VVASFSAGLCPLSPVPLLFVASVVVPPAWSPLHVWWSPPLFVVGGPPLFVMVVPIHLSWWCPFVHRGWCPRSFVVGDAPVRPSWVVVPIRSLWVVVPVCLSWWSLFVHRGWCPFVRCGGPPRSSVCGPTLDRHRWCTVSTHDPPCEQWLAGLGTGAGVWLMWWWCPSSSLSHHRVVSPSSRLGGQRDVAGVWARALTSYRAGDGSLSPLFGPW
jgi:hypothetical protein